MMIMFEEIKKAVLNSSFGSFYAIEKHVGLKEGKNSLSSKIKRKIKDVEKTNEVFKLFGYEIIIRKIKPE